MKTSQWRWAVENTCVFNACLKTLSDRSGDRSAGGRRFREADALTTKFCCPVAVRARGTSECQSLQIADADGNGLTQMSLSCCVRLHLQCRHLFSSY